MNLPSRELRLFVEDSSPAQQVAMEPMATRWLLSAAIAAMGVLVGCAVLAGFQPPLWFQPTLVGILWGLVFLIGFAMGSFGRGSFLAATLAGVLTWLMNQSFLQITDLPPADCLLLSTLLLSSGWVIARLDRAHLFSSIPTAHAQSAQWSIGDIAFSTALAACLVQAFVHCTPTLLLLSAIMALAGGIVCSWLAYRWVWLDQYSLVSLLVAFVGLVSATLYIHHVAPVDATFWESVRWICVGPVNVIASQATSVLMVLALIRFESQGQGAALACSKSDRRSDQRLLT